MRVDTLHGWIKTSPGPPSYWWPQLHAASFSILHDTSDIPDEMHVQDSDGCIRLFGTPSAALKAALKAQQARVAALAPDRPSKIFGHLDTTWDALQDLMVASGRDLDGLNRNLAVVLDGLTRIHLGITQCERMTCQSSS